MENPGIRDLRCEVDVVLTADLVMWRRAVLLVVVLAWQSLGFGQARVVPRMDYGAWPELRGRECEAEKRFPIGVRCQSCRVTGVRVLGMPVEWVTEHYRPGLPLMRAYWFPEEQYSTLIGVLVWLYGPPRFDAPSLGYDRGDDGKLVVTGAYYTMSWKTAEAGRTLRIRLGGAGSRGSAGNPCLPAALKGRWYGLFVERVDRDSGEEWRPGEGGGDEGPPVEGKNGGRAG